MSQYLPISNPLSGGVYTPPIGTVTIFSTPIHGPSGTKTIGPLQITLTLVSTDEVLNLVFASATSITVTQPPNATLAVINPPSGSLIGLTLKGVSGDTGVPIATNLPCLISFPTTTGGATFTLTSAAAIVGSVEVDFA